MRKTILLFGFLALAACKDGSGPTTPTPTLTLSADSVSVSLGQSITVSATVSNSSATPLFESRNQAVAQVSAAGAISGVGIGRTVIVSTLTGNPSVRDSVIVNVRVAAPLQIPLLGSGAVPERYTGEIAVAEPFAYTATWNTRAAPGNAIKIWNVTGNTPILVDSLILAGAGTVSDVQISSDGALLVASTEFGAAVNNGIAIYDRSNTAKPVLIRRYTNASAAPGVHTVKLSRINNRHYAFMNVNPTLTIKAKLSIVDITDPANPVEVSVRELGDPYIHDVFIRDGVLFTALWHTGLTIFDVGGAGRGGSPANPVAMGTVKTVNCSVCGVGLSYAHNVWWFHDPSTNGKRYAFVGEEGPSNSGGFTRSTGAVHVIDVSDFNAPREVAVYEPDSTTTYSGRAAGAHNFVMDEASGVLYAAFYNAGVRALDVRGDLGTCAAAQKTADGRCDLRLMGREIGVGLSNPNNIRFIWGVALQGNNLYASDMPNGIHKLNISALRR